MLFQPIVPLHGLRVCCNGDSLFVICVFFTETDMEDDAADETEADDCDHQPLRHTTYTQYSSPHMWSRNKINSVLATIYFISAPSVCTYRAEVK